MGGIYLIAKVAELHKDWLKITIFGILLQGYAVDQPNHYI